MLLGMEFQIFAPEYLIDCRVLLVYNCTLCAVGEKNWIDFGPPHFQNGFAIAGSQTVNKESARKEIDSASL